MTEPVPLVKSISCVQKNQNSPIFARMSIIENRKDAYKT